MDISKLDKAAVLAVLYNSARLRGIEGMHFSTPEKMTREEALMLLVESQDKYFDYILGRAMKIDLSNDELDTWLYNRDNGSGAAEAAIAGLYE